jgi:hypothetical protein
MPAVPFKRIVHHIIMAVPALCALLLFGCGNESSPDHSSDNPIPKGTVPCKHPEYWPYSVASSKFPFLVHYRSENELAAARQIISYLDTAWERQIQHQGYTPPPSDAGMCGPDERFDVFLWNGVKTCKVDIISDLIVTNWGGRASYMQLDPWGPYGGEILAQTVAHEFNHATHAANDWYEIPIAFEMSATYVEQFYGPPYVDSAKDFQARPDWALLRNDNYETWYMYGAAIYLHFLRDNYFNGDDGFLPELWVLCRNQPDLYVNKPNFVDGINTILAPKGAAFLNSVVDFARWRYYSGSRDDGLHFRRVPVSTTPLALLPEATLSIDQVTLKPLVHKISPAPMLTGSAYLEIKRESAAQASFQLSLDVQFAPSVKWVVQAVPGLTAGSDGEIVDLSSGSARVSFTQGGSRTLILTVLPVADFDPYHQLDVSFPVSVSIAP